MHTEDIDATGWDFYLGRDDADGEFLLALGAQRHLDRFRLHCSTSSLFSGGFKRALAVQRTSQRPGEALGVYFSGCSPAVFS
jgi:hypothetical protein